MSIVTKTGDNGTTGLLGGLRVSKASPRLHAYGTVDELNAILGLVLTEKKISESLRAQLGSLQHTLFRLGADLSAPVHLHIPRMAKEDIARLEETHEEGYTATQEDISASPHEMPDSPDM